MIRIPNKIKEQDINQKEISKLYSKIIGKLSKINKQSIISLFKTLLIPSIESGNLNEIGILLGSMKNLEFSISTENEIEEIKSFIEYILTLITKKTKGEIISHCYRLIGNLLIPLSIKKENPNLNYNHFREWITELYYSNKKTWKKLKDSVSPLIMEVGILCNGKSEFFAQQPLSVFERLGKLTKYNDKNRSIILDCLFYLLYNVLTKYNNNNVENHSNRIDIQLILDKYSMEIFPFATGKKSILPQMNCISVLTDISSLIGCFYMDYSVRHFILSPLLQQNEYYERTFVAIQSFYQLAERLALSFVIHNKNQSSENIDIILHSNQRTKIIKQIKTVSTLSDESLHPIQKLLGKLIQNLDQQIGNYLSIKRITKNKESFINQTSSSSSSNQINSQGGGSGGVGIIHDDTQNSILKDEKQQQYLSKEKNIKFLLLQKIIKLLFKITPIGLNSRDFFNFIVKICFHIDNKISCISFQLLYNVMKTRPAFRSLLIEEIVSFIISIPDSDISNLHSALTFLNELLLMWKDPIVLNKLDTDMDNFTNENKNLSCPAYKLEALALIMLCNRNSAIRSDGLLILENTKKLNEILPPLLANDSPRVFLILQVNEKILLSRVLKDSIFLTMSKKSSIYENKFDSLSQLLTSMRIDDKQLFICRCIGEICKIISTNCKNVLKIAFNYAWNKFLILLMKIQNHLSSSSSSSSTNTNSYHDLRDSSSSSSSSVSSSQLQNQEELLLIMLRNYLTLMLSGGGSMLLENPKKQQQQQNQQQQNQIDLLLSKIFPYLLSSNIHIRFSIHYSIQFSCKSIIYKFLIKLFSFYDNELQTNKKKEIFIRFEITKIICICSHFINISFLRNYIDIINLYLNFLNDNYLYLQNNLSKDNNHNNHLNNVFNSSFFSLFYDNLSPFIIIIHFSYDLFRSTCSLLKNLRLINNDLLSTLRIEIPSTKLREIFFNTAIKKCGYGIWKSDQNQQKLLDLIQNNNNSTSSTPSSLFFSNEININHQNLFLICNSQQQQLFVDDNFQQHLNAQFVSFLSSSITQQQQQQQQNLPTLSSSFGLINNNNTNNNSSSSSSSSSINDFKNYYASNSMYFPSNGSSSFIHEIRCTQYWSFSLLNEVLHYSASSFNNQEIFCDIGPLFAIANDVFASFEHDKDQFPLIKSVTSMFKSFICNQKEYSDQLFTICIEKSFLDNNNYISQGYLDIIVESLKFQPLQFNFRISQVLLLGLFKLTDPVSQARQNSVQLLQWLSNRFYKNLNQTKLLDPLAPTKTVYEKQFEKITNSYSLHHPEIINEILIEIIAILSRSKNNQSSIKQMLRLCNAWFKNISLIQLEENIQQLIQNLLILTYKFGNDYDTYIEKIWYNLAIYNENDDDLDDHLDDDLDDDDLFNFKGDQHQNHGVSHSSSNIIIIFDALIHIYSNHQYSDLLLSLNKIIVILFHCNSELIVQLCTEIFHPYVPYFDYQIINNQKIKNRYEYPPIDTKIYFDQEWDFNHIFPQNNIYNHKYFTQNYYEQTTSTTSTTSKRTTKAETLSSSVDNNEEMDHHHHQVNNDFHHTIIMKPYSFILFFLPDLLILNTKAFYDIIPVILHYTIIQIDHPNYYIAKCSKEVLITLISCCLSNEIKTNHQLLKHYIEFQKFMIQNSKKNNLWSYEDAGILKEIKSLTSVKIIKELISILLKCLLPCKKTLREEWSKIIIFYLSNNIINHENNNNNNNLLNYEIRSSINNNHIISRSLQILRSLESPLDKNILSTLGQLMIFSIQKRICNDIQISLEIMETLRLNCQFTSRNTLRRLPQLFWFAVAMLNTNVPEEFCSSVLLLSSLIDDMQIQSDMVYNALLCTEPQQWKPIPFQGLFLLLLKGMCSRKTEFVSRKLFTRLTMSPCSKLLHHDEQLRYLIPTIALLPFLITSMGGEDSIEISEKLAGAYLLWNKPKLVRLLTGYQVFTTSEEGMRRFIYEYTEMIADLFFPTYELFIFTILIEFLNNGPPSNERSIIQILSALFGFIDKSNSLLFSYSSNNHLPLLSLSIPPLESKFWNESLIYLESILSNSSTHSSSSFNLLHCEKSFNLTDNIPHTWQRLNNYSSSSTSNNNNNLSILLSLREALNPAQKQSNSIKIANEIDIRDQIKSIKLGKHEIPLVSSSNLKNVQDGDHHLLHQKNSALRDRSCSFQNVRVAPTSTTPRAAFSMGANRQASPRTLVRDNQTESNELLLSSSSNIPTDVKLPPKPNDNRPKTPQRNPPSSRGRGGFASLRKLPPNTQVDTAPIVPPRRRGSGPLRGTRQPPNSNFQRERR